MMKREQLDEMFNARRGGLSLAVLYWCMRRTLELTAALGTRGTRFQAVQPLLSCCSSLLSRTGRTSVKVVALCDEMRDICSVGGDSRSPHAAAAHRSLRAWRAHLFPKPEKEPSQAGILPFGQPLCSRIPILKHFQETCAGGGGLLHSAEASRSGRVWSRVPLQELMKEFRLNQLLDHKAKKNYNEARMAGVLCVFYHFQRIRWKTAAGRDATDGRWSFQVFENEEQISQFSTVKKWIMSVEHILTKTHKSKICWLPNPHHPHPHPHLSHSL